MLNEDAKGRLRSSIERYERVERERAECDEMLKEILAEVKGAGFDTALFKETVKVRKQDKGARAEKASLLDLYLEAAGGA